MNSQPANPHGPRAVPATRLNSPKSRSMPDGLETRHTLRLWTLLALVICQSSIANAQILPTWPTITNLLVNPLRGPTNVPVTFTLLSGGYVPFDIFYVSGETYTATNGWFSNQISPGDYSVAIGPHRDLYKITVPDTSNQFYSLATLIGNGLTTNFPFGGGGGGGGGAQTLTGDVTGTLSGTTIATILSPVLSGTSYEFPNQTVQNSASLETSGQATNDIFANTLSATNFPFNWGSNFFGGPGSNIFGAIVVATNVGNIFDGIFTGNGAGLTGVPGATGGTVTSVGLSVPSDESVGSSPITGSGTLAITRNSQSQNLVLASPNGSSGVPGYRQSVAADLAAGGTFPAINGSALSGISTNNITGLVADLATLAPTNAPTLFNALSWNLFGTNGIGSGFAFNSDYCSIYDGTSNALNTNQFIFKVITNGVKTIYGDTNGFLTLNGETNLGNSKIGGNLTVAGTANVAGLTTLANQTNTGWQAIAGNSTNFGASTFVGGVTNVTMSPSTLAATGAGTNMVSIATGTGFLNGTGSGLPSYTQTGSTLTNMPQMLEWSTVTSQTIAGNSVKYYSIWGAPNGAGSGAASDSQFEVGIPLQAPYTLSNFIFWNLRNRVDGRNKFHNKIFYQQCLLRFYFHHFGSEFRIWVCYYKRLFRLHIRDWNELDKQVYAASIKQFRLYFHIHISVGRLPSH